MNAWKWRREGLARRDRVDRVYSMRKGYTRRMVEAAARAAQLQLRWEGAPVRTHPKRLDHRVTAYSRATIFLSICNQRKLLSHYSALSSSF